MTSTNNSFGKEKHLKSRKQIDQLFTGGKAFFVHPIKVFWRMEVRGDEMQKTDDGRRTTDEIQLTEDRRQRTGEMQTTDDGRPGTDEIQLTVDGEKAIVASKIKASENRLSDIGQPLPVVSHPSSVVGRPSSVAHRPSSAVSIGVSASKRNFKKAVDRNRVKRLLREAYRLNQHDLQQAMQGKSGSLQVFFIFVDKTIPTFALVQEKMLICLKRLQKIAGEAKNEKLL